MIKDGDPELGYLNIPIWMAFSPDSKHIYGGGGRRDGNRNKLLILARDQLTGKLDYVMHDSTGQAVEWQRGGISVSPDGSMIYTLNKDTDEIGVFEKKRHSGILQKLQNININDSVDLIMI